VQLTKKNIKNTGEDDWDTDPNFVNDVSEKDQRWGSKQGGGKAKEVVNMNELRTQVQDSNAQASKDAMAKKTNYAYGYGGKFGVQADRMDKSAHTAAVTSNDKDTSNTSYKPQGPLKDTKSAAKAFEDKAAAAKVEPPKPAPRANAPKWTPPPAAPKPAVTAPKPAITGPKPVAKTFSPPKPREPEPEPVVVVREPEPEPEPIPEPVVVVKVTEEWTEPAPAATEEWTESAPVEPVQAATDDWNNSAQPATDDWSNNAPAQPATDDWSEQPQEQLQEQPQEQLQEQPPQDSGQGGDQNSAVPTQCKAIYDFEAQDETELGFKVDDVITVLQAIDNEWWQGEIDGRVGIFPVSYIQPV